MKIKRICQICKNIFYSTPYIIKFIGAKYCSKKCAGIAHRQYKHSFKTIQKMKNHNAHFWKNKKRSKETCRKISKANKGKTRTVEQRKRISTSKLGIIPWNKGIHTGIKPWLGKKRSPETIAKFKARKGKIPKHLNKLFKEKIFQKGYIYVYKPSHPLCTKREKRVLEHRLVMEKHLKRFLKPEEVVHHINSNISDNRIENLKLFNNEAEHQKFHCLFK